MLNKLARNVFGGLIIVVLILIFMLTTWLYLSLAQDDVMLTFESGSVLTSDDTQKIMVNRMQVFVTDADLDLADMAIGEEVLIGDVYSRITSHMQILLPCEIVTSNLLQSASDWASGAIVLSYTVGEDEPACAISLMIVDHRSPRIPWPDAPGLHQL